MNDKLTVIPDAALMPVLDMGQAIERRNLMQQFVKRILVPGIDFGTIPGTNDKDVLLKPGAEKLTTFFGLSKKFVIIERAEDWDAPEPFFYYFYRCQLYKGDLLIGEADGSCNSRESKYRWRWVGEDELPPDVNPAALMTRRSQIVEPEWAINKAETSGKWGKPLEYWEAFQSAIVSGDAYQTTKKKRNGEEMKAWAIASTSYRIPNPDIASQVNTIQKMAQKRAFIAAALVAVNASDYFTQDLEDFTDGEIVTGEPVIIEQPKQGPPPPAQPPSPPQPEPEQPAAAPQWMEGMILQAEMDYGLSDEQVIQLLRSRGVERPQESSEAMYKKTISELMSAPNNPIAVMVAVNLHLVGAGKESGYTNIHHLKNSIVKQMEFGSDWSWPGSASADEWAEATQAAINYGMEHAK